MKKLYICLEIGISRIRGNKTGGVQALNTWSTVVLSTGEETISTNNSTTGVQTRCLEIEGSPFDDNEKKASEMYHITSKFHGTAGPEFINRIIEKYAENDFIDLKEIHNEIISKVKDITENDVLSYISAVSIVTLADILIGKWFFNEDEELSYEMAKFILKKLDKSQDMDIIDKAYEYIISWIVSNHKSFDLYKEPITTHLTNKGLIEKLNPQNDLVENERTKKSFGIFDKDVYYIFRDILEDKLENKGYSYRKIITEFAQRGYIAPTRDKDGNISTTTVQKKYRNVNTRMFAFPVEIINKFLEGKELEDTQKEFQAYVHGCNSYEEFEKIRKLKPEDLIKEDEKETEELHLRFKDTIEELEKF